MFVLGEAEREGIRKVTLSQWEMHERQRTSIFTSHTTSHITVFHINPSGFCLSVREMDGF